MCFSRTGGGGKKWKKRAYSFFCIVTQAQGAELVLFSIKTIPQGCSSLPESCFEAHASPGLTYHVLGLGGENEKDPVWHSRGTDLRSSRDKVRVRGDTGPSLRKDSRCVYTCLCVLHPFLAKVMNGEGICNGEKKKLGCFVNGFCYQTRPSPLLVITRFVFFFSPSPF